MISAAIAIVVFFIADVMGVQDDGSKLLIAGGVYGLLGVADLVRIWYLGQIEEPACDNVHLFRRIEALESEVMELRHRGTIGNAGHVVELRDPDNHRRAGPRTPTARIGEAGYYLGERR